MTLLKEQPIAADLQCLLSRGQDNMVKGRILQSTIVTQIGSLGSCPPCIYYILSTRYCKSAAIGYSVNNVIVSFLKCQLILSNRQCCHFPAILRNTGIFQTGQSDNTVIVLFAQQVLLLSLQLKLKLTKRYDMSESGNQKAN